MALDRKYIGRTYGPFPYQVGLEKMREFAFAVSGGIPSAGFGVPPDGLDPLLFDQQAGNQSTYGSVIAFPTFPGVVASRPLLSAVPHPGLGRNLLILWDCEQEVGLV